jgi:hypothetical protein
MLRDVIHVFKTLLNNCWLTEKVKKRNYLNKKINRVKYIYFFLALTIAPTIIIIPIIMTKNSQK